MVNPFFQNNGPFKISRYLRIIAINLIVIRDEKIMILKI